MNWVTLVRAQDHSENREQEIHMNGSVGRREQLPSEATRRGSPGPLRPASRGRSNRAEWGPDAFLLFRMPVRFDS